MKDRQKLHHFCSTFYHKIFISNELSLKNIGKIGSVFKLDFRAQPRFGALWARDLRLKRYKLQPFVYHLWKFEDDILSRFGEYPRTKWHPENRKIVNISDRKWRHCTKNYFQSFWTNIHHHWKFHENPSRRFGEIE